MEDMGFISHYEIEWRLVYDRMRVVIVDKLCVRDLSVQEPELDPQKIWRYISTS